MENFAMIALAEELREATEGMVVRRVVEHHPAGFLLQTRAVRIPALKISMDARNPVLYVSDARPPVESVTTDFLLSLRKHLNSARLLSLEKPLSERIVELRFKTTLPAKELETVTLVAELFPNAPNLFLLDHRRRILDWFSRPSSRRALVEYGEYHHPNTDRLDLEVVLQEDPAWFDHDAFQKDSRAWLIRTLAGIGPVFAREIAERRSRWKGDILGELKKLIQQLRSPATTAWVYSERPLSIILKHNDLDALRRAVVTPIELLSLEGVGSQTYPGMLEATRFVADALESRTLLEKAKRPTRRRLQDQRRRLENQRQRLLERQRAYEQARELQRSAQLLSSSGADMDRCYEELKVTDYFEEPPRKRTLALDPSKTLRDNVTGMFKRHQKARRGKGMVEKQLEEIEPADRRLRAEEGHIQSIGDWYAWLAYSGAKPGRRTPPGKREQVRPGRRRAIQIGDHEVFVGRNGRENDELTFKLASGEDFWFHVAGYTGSHVIVRNPTKQTELRQELLVRAAQLAAYYSQARNSQKVEVHYTLKKFVSKPKKAKPGLVRLREFKTITVEPRGWSASEGNSQDTSPGETTTDCEVGSTSDNNPGTKRS